MIDLTKPIRRKTNGEKVRFAPMPFYHLISPVSKSLAYSADEMEAHFENIPEPRRPREWRGFVDGNNRFVIDNDPLPIGGGYIRVIEWPEGAPLPEWPT